ncbi:MAG TPA: hypothetical protein VF026_10540 [Ktedonobacteraceae bacterium]
MTGDNLSHKGYFLAIGCKEIAGLWKTVVKTTLDNFSLRVGKSFIISEIGYRHTADALYDPWARYSTGSPPGPEEQAACDAVLRSISWVTSSEAGTV